MIFSSKTVVVYKIFQVYQFNTMHQEIIKLKMTDRNFYHDALYHIELLLIWLADFFNTSKDLGLKFLDAIFSATIC